MLFFIHIPKTAGVSVFDALRRMAPNRIAWHTGPETLPAKFFSASDIRKSISIYGGHFGYEQIRNFLAPGDKIYSAIRDPIERVFSYYNHVTVRDPKHPLLDQIRGLRLIEAAEVCSRFRWDITNSQCWYLSGTKKFTDARRVVAAGEIQVFTMSQLNLMVRHMSLDCGVSDPPEVIAYNVAQNDYKMNILPEEREFVNDLNREDKRLVEYVFSQLAPTLPTR